MFFDPEGKTIEKFEIFRGKFSKPKPEQQNIDLTSIKNF